jgi:hypothetical protein
MMALHAFSDGTMGTGRGVVSPEQAKALMLERIADAFELIASTYAAKMKAEAEHDAALREAHQSAMESFDRWVATAPEADTIRRAVESDRGLKGGEA